MRKIIVTGSNGLIGRQIVNSLTNTKQYQVCGVSAGVNRNNHADFAFFQADITDINVFSKILKAFNPDIIIHTAAMGSPDKCEESKAEAWKINVDAPGFIAEYCRINNVFLLHWSTDFVFDGLKGYYNEDDEPNPVSYYGLTKLESEKVVLDTCIDACVFRTILVYGAYPEMTRPNIFTRVIAAAAENKNMRIACDQYRMPTFVDDLANAVLLAVEKRPSGIFHLSGNEYMSVYEFVMKIAEKFNLDKNIFQPVLSSDLNEKAKRPAKTGFVLSKAISDLGYNPTSITNALMSLSNR